MSANGDIVLRDGDRPILQAFRLILGGRDTRRRADCLDNLTRGGMNKLDVASAMT